MKIAVCTSLILSLFILAGCTSGKFSTETDTDKSGYSLFDPKKMEVLAEAGKLSLNDRMATLGSLRAAMRTSYFGYYLKKQLIGISGDEIFDLCEMNEKQNPEPSYMQEFNDRMLICIGKFHDSHFNFVKMPSTNFVQNAIGSAIWLGGELVITQLRDKLIAALVANGAITAESAKLLAIGAIIKSIDGKIPMDAMKEFEIYQSESSEAASIYLSTWNLFYRSFAYPKSAVVRYEIQAKDGSSGIADVPWISSESSDGLETPHILRKLKIPESSTFDIEKITESTGFSSLGNVFAEIQSRTIYNYDKEKILETGLVSVGTEQACYYSLSAFDIDRNAETKKYLIKTEAGTDVDILEISKAFFDSCVGKTLILNFRSNPGGNSNLQSLLNLLLESQASAPIFTANSYRFDSGAKGLMAVSLGGVQSGDPETEVAAEAFFKSINGNEPITDWVLDRPKTPVYSLFQGNIIALIDKRCVSACEGFVRRLSLNKKVTLIGSPTAGTGFGYMRFNSNESTWRDPMNNFKMNIPNDAFRSVTEIKDGTALENETVIAGRLDFKDAVVLENTPMQPNVPYVLQIEDLNAFAGYKKLIEKVYKDINK